jgi:hypothetical protein
LHMWGFGQWGVVGTITTKELLVNSDDIDKGFSTKLASRFLGIGQRRQHVVLDMIVPIMGEDLVGTLKRARTFLADANLLGG